MGNLKEALKNEYSVESEAKTYEHQIEKILQDGRIEFGLRSLFSPAKIEIGYLGNGHDNTETKIQTEQDTDEFREEFYLFLPHSIGPSNANMCSEVLWGSHKLTKELKQSFLDLENTNENPSKHALTSFLFNSEGKNITDLPSDAQALAKTILSHPEFGGDFSFEAMLHPHGAFESDNKTAIYKLATLEIPELEEKDNLSESEKRIVDIKRVALGYLWQLLSNHVFSKTDKEGRKHYFGSLKEEPLLQRLELIRDQINDKWDTYLNNCVDIYADGSSRAFLDSPEISEKLRNLADTYGDLIRHRKEEEAARIEKECLVELSSENERGMEFATNIVKHSILGNEEGIKRLTDAYTQDEFDINITPTEDIQLINSGFEAGIRNKIEEFLNNEESINKIDLRAVARNLIALHGVDISQEELLNYQLSDIDLENLESNSNQHEVIAVALVNNFIGEIAEEYEIETGIPRNTELAESLKSLGFNIVNTHLFTDIHGGDDMAGYHAILNPNTGEAEMCADHGKNMDFELQEGNRDIEGIIANAEEVDYTEVSDDFDSVEREQEPALYGIIPRRVNTVRNLINLPKEGISFPPIENGIAGIETKNISRRKPESRFNVWRRPSLPTITLNPNSNFQSLFGTRTEVGNRIVKTGTELFGKRNNKKRGRKSNFNASLNGKPGGDNTTPTTSGVSFDFAIPKGGSTSPFTKPKAPPNTIGGGANSKTETKGTNTIPASGIQETQIGSKLEEAFQKVENQTSSTEIENKNQQERKEEEQRSDLSQNAAETANALGKEGGTKTIVSKTGERIEIKLMNGTPPTTPRTVTNQARKKSSTRVIKSSTGEEIKLQMVGNGPQTQAPAKQRNLNSSAKKRTISAFNQQAASLQLSATNDALRIDEIRTSLQDAITYAKTPIAA